MPFSPGHIEAIQKVIEWASDTEKPSVVLVVTDTNREYHFEFAAAEQVVADVLPDVRPWIDVHGDDYLAAFPKPGTNTAEISIRGELTSNWVRIKAPGQPGAVMEVAYEGRLISYNKAGKIFASSTGEEVKWYEARIALSREPHANEPHDQAVSMMLTESEVLNWPTGGTVEVTLKVTAP